MSTVRDLRILTLTIAFSVLFAGIALADNAGVDGDFATVGLQSTLAFGELCPESSPTTKPANWYVVRQGNADQNNYQDGSTVSFALRPPNEVDITGQPAGGDSQLGFAFPGSHQVTLPEEDLNAEPPVEAWKDLGNGSLSDPVVGHITVTPGEVSGNYTGVVKMRAAGPNQSTGTTITNNADLTVTWTVLEDDDPLCVAAGPSYLTRGFYSPVSMTEMNRARGGQGVPLKFNVWEDEISEENEITDPVLHGTAFRVRSYQIPCGTEEFAPNEAEIVAPGESGFRYDDTAVVEDAGGHFVYVWKTNKTWDGTCRSVEVTYDGDQIEIDGSDPVAYLTADFKFGR